MHPPKSHDTCTDDARNLHALPQKMANHPYLNLERRFSIHTDLLLEPSLLDFVEENLTWDDVLKGRYSVIVAKANFGKSEELQERARLMRAVGQFAVFVPLHQVLGEDGFNGALTRDDATAFEMWRREGGELTMFVDSLDEASLVRTEGGLRRALTRVFNAVKPDSNVKWVLSSRPAVLTPEVVNLLESEFGAALYVPPDADEVAPSPLNVGVANKDGVWGDLPRGITHAAPLVDAPDPSTIGSTDTANAEIAAVKREPLKVYRLLPLRSSAAELYLSGVRKKANVAKTLQVARQYGLAQLARWPGGLDVLAHIDLENHAPNCLTEVLEKMVAAMQMQQRVDPRETEVRVTNPENFTTAMERLACASIICKTKSIALSDDALPVEVGSDALSARHLVAGMLTQPQMRYLLGSHLFADAGHHQVKI